jgi:hypothetical protein
LDIYVPSIPALRKTPEKEKGRHLGRVTACLVALLGQFRQPHWHCWFCDWRHTCRVGQREPASAEAENETIESNVRGLPDSVKNEECVSKFVVAGFNGPPRPPERGHYANFETLLVLRSSIFRF